ncbi:retrovirus-related pol polyprotein from transposon TNT 1-94 [Tanacetum coccineum]|uniref:Retrovirus-related pol polyprotein from transposon TNT 1-94 n=1 Tax=Tanacetum coccineum TaxID=301880 RepID=A0ABQ4WLK2_9ASTR
MPISKKKALNIKLPLLEHLNRMALSKDGTVLLLRLLERCFQLLSFHYHFGLKQFADRICTQNRSIIISTHEKTAYHIINDRKPSIKHLHIFGCTCYITRDGENLDKMKEKGDPCVMVGYSTQIDRIVFTTRRQRLIVEPRPQGNKSRPDYDNADPGPPNKKLSFCKKTDRQIKEEGIDLKNHCLQLLAVWKAEEFMLLRAERVVEQIKPEKVLPSKEIFVGLKQAPRAWYDELSNFLMSKGFTKGQIPHSPKGIFINQAKYALEILKKHNMDNCHSIGTPLATKPKLDVDLSGEPVDQSDYRSKIGSLMYLTSSRPDLVQAVCYCARYQARPTQKHLKEVKRIFKYLKGTINMGLWYPKDSGFELTAFSDADHAGCLDTRKSTSGGIQFLGDKLVSWMSKKQNCTAMSSAEAEYVALFASCAQVMWMRTQLQDYGFNYNKIPLYCDSQSAIAISCNPVQHSRTKHIHTRYHFIKEQVENGIIELYFVRTEYQLADMFTKALPEDRFKISCQKDWYERFDTSSIGADK